MAECTKEEFRNSMVNKYKDTAVDWADPYSPILDVTETVKKVYPNVNQALLAIYGNNPNTIQVEGPYDGMPPARPPQEIVALWERGQEWERQKCLRNGKWYWVKYPCRLATNPTLFDTLLFKLFAILNMLGLPI